MLAKGTGSNSTELNSSRVSVGMDESFKNKLKDKQEEL